MRAGSRVSSQRLLVRRGGKRHVMALIGEIVSPLDGGWLCTVHHSASIKHHGMNRQTNAMVVVLEIWGEDGEMATQAYSPVLAVT